MKKSKILSFVLAIAMLISLVPAVMVSAADSNVIWEEDFSTGNTYGGENASIVDGALKAGTGSGNGGFNFNTLSAAVADAPEGKVQVKFDIKANVNGGGRAKIELKTNTSNVFLIDFGQYNFLRPSDQNASYNNVSFSGNTWYTSDIVLDFDNDKLIINVAERESGTSILTDFEYAYDLSAVTTITGIDAYGWGCANDTYYDNFSITYVEEVQDEPEEPGEFDPVIWEEDFSTGNTYGGENASIVDGALKAGTGAGNGGFNFDTLAAAVADAPMGQIRVKWDMKVQSQVASVAKVELKTDAGNKFLINFGQYNTLRPDENAGNFEPSAMFDNGVWYTSDIVLDFENNKLIMNVASRDGSDVRMSNFEYAYDLSGVNTIKGIDAYGWACAGDTYYDNFLIEYVEEEGSDDPIVPEEPAFEAVIWEEDFEGDATLASRVDTVNGSVAIEDGMLKAPNGTGIVVNSKNAAVADAPMGQIRVKWDVNVQSQAGSVSKAELVTDAGNIYLINYGQYNELRPSHPVGSYDPVAMFDNGVWYTSDIVLDFDNNKLILNVASVDGSDVRMSNFEYACDLSAVNTIKGIDVYGWGNAGDTYYDNFLIEYVEEGSDEPIIPDEPSFEVVIWEEDFSTGETYGGDNASIVDETLKAGTGVGNGGFNFATLNAAVADAPMGQIRVKWDMKVQSQAGSVAKVELKTDAGNKFLINFGQYNELRPDESAGSYSPVAMYDNNKWYTNDIILDFENNKLIMNVASTDGSDVRMSNFEYACDLSGVNTIKGIDAYGWGCAGDTYYDNFLIEYVVGEFDVNADSISIWTNDYEEYIANVAPGANKIVIDFGTAVKESSLEGAVTLTNVTDANANVEFEGTLSGSKYTMTFDGLLANKTYKLAISGNIENVLGETIGHDYDLSFTTTNGDFKASLVSLKQGSTVIDDLGDITAGDATVTVSFEKTSPSGKTIKVLYAFYNGNKMETVVVHDIVIGEEEISGTKTDTVTFGTLEGITNVKVMLWEDFLTINPLCAEIDL